MTIRPIVDTATDGRRGLRKRDSVVLQFLGEGFESP